jgi:hypothetical protein
MQKQQQLRILHCVQEDNLCFWESEVRGIPGPQVRGTGGTLTLSVVGSQDDPALRRA